MNRHRLGVADKTRAFSLIELLVVVAIIAILAAIAVPNFLEAQIRSKVSRAQADLRVIASAVYAYAIDNLSLPLDADDRPDYNPMNPMCYLWWNQKAWFTVLTTPMAYLTSIPSDVFTLRQIETDQRSFVLHPGDPPYSYSYLTRQSYRDHQGRPTEFGIISVGPNHFFDSMAEGGANDLYDPTNGSLSRGDIVRQGP